ncbi:MAG TPA: hypothetical protein PKC35_20790, partial [Leptospiraceae bacterium]|nr:hypothetical protein [Leptospiraceae bacterium]
PNTFNSPRTEDNVSIQTEHSTPLPDPVERHFAQKECLENRQTCKSTCQAFLWTGFFANAAVNHTIGGENTTETCETRCNRENLCPPMITTPQRR